MLLRSHVLSSNHMTTVQRFAIAIITAAQCGSAPPLIVRKAPVLAPDMHTPTAGQSNNTSPQLQLNKLAML